MIPVSALQVGVKTSILMGQLMERRFCQSAIGTEEGNIRREKVVGVMERFNNRQEYYVVAHV